MSRNFQPFQQVIDFSVLSGPITDTKEPINRIGTCRPQAATDEIVVENYGTAHFSNFLTRKFGDVRVSKVIINEPTDIEGIGTKDIVVSITTKDASGTFAKTEFKYLEADNGAKVFQLADGDLSLVPEDLAELRIGYFFGDGSASECLPTPATGHLRIMITLELPRA